MNKLECSGYLLWRIPQFEVVRDFPPKYIPRLQTALDFGLGIKSAAPILSSNCLVFPTNKGSALRADIHRRNPAISL